MPSKMASYQSSLVDAKKNNPEFFYEPNQTVELAPVVPMLGPLTQQNIENRRASLYCVIMVCFLFAATSVERICSNGYRT